MPSPAARRFAEISRTGATEPPRVFLRRAVVLGGSMAGMLAARVLSEHAEDVVVIERDTAAADRPDSQAHALSPAGAAQLERWFPGVVAEAVRAGAVVPPADGARSRRYVDGRALRHPPPAPAVPAFVCARPFLDDLVGRTALARPNIHRAGGRADGLDFHGDRVVGAWYVPQGRASAVSIDADLVVDATGRDSALGDWLAADGWPRPKARRMEIRLNYATAMFAYDETISDLWRVTSRAAADSGTDGRARAGGIQRVDGDRWSMFVTGYRDDRPWADFGDFVERCHRDFPGVFGDIATNARRLGGVVAHHHRDNRRYDLHAPQLFPAGLVVAGDAVASLNPLHDQGMTSAMLHAACLSRYLRGGPSLREPAAGYFDLVKTVVDAGWQVATLADLELPFVDGPYPRFYPTQRRLSRSVARAALVDRRVDARVARIATLESHPHSVLRPMTMVRTGLRAGVRWWRERRQSRSIVDIRDPARRPVGDA